MTLRVDLDTVVLIFNTAFVTLMVARLVYLLRHRGGAAGCVHCWHWMYTSRMGTTIHQHCCRCGHLRATYVVGRDAMVTLRSGEHGEYVEYKSEQDRGVA